jgi:hypothetical protein
MTFLSFWLPYGLICFALVYFAGVLIERWPRPLAERKDVRAILAALGDQELYGAGHRRTRQRLARSLVRAA